MQILVASATIMKENFPFESACFWLIVARTITSGWDDMKGDYGNSPCHTFY